MVLEAVKLGSESTRLDFAQECLYNTGFNATRCKERNRTDGEHRVTARTPREKNKCSDEFKLETWYDA